MTKKSGNRVLAETLKAYGSDHFFHVPMIVPPAVVDMTAIGVEPVVTHSEKAPQPLCPRQMLCSRGTGVLGPAWWYHSVLKTTTSHRRDRWKSVWPPPRRLQVMMPLSAS